MTQTLHTYLAGPVEFPAGIDALGLPRPLRFVAVFGVADSPEHLHDMAVELGMYGIKTPRVRKFIHRNDWFTPIPALLAAGVALDAPGIFIVDYSGFGQVLQVSGVGQFTPIATIDRVGSCVIATPAHM